MQAGKVFLSFDENVQERDCTVLFEFNGKFDICVTVIEIVQELGSMPFFFLLQFILLLFYFILLFDLF